jgi:hypothetical protein
VWRDFDLGGKLNLRVYDGPRLEVDVPLTRARALLLATS